MLLMALPNEHLLTFNQYKDAKTLFDVIQTRFGGNEATKKTQKTLLKQMYENFSAPSTESLDFIFDRLQKIVSQLAILGENISQEDLNLNFLRSLLSEWNTHVVVWRNKPDLDTMSFDDLYKNFKIVEQEVKRTISSSLKDGVSTANTQDSPASTQVSTTSTQVSTANLSDATVYAFLASQPNGSQLVHEDLEQIHEDDLEEMDLKWHDTAEYDKSKVECFNCHKMGHFARERIGPRNQDSKNRNQDSSRRTINVEETSSKAIVAIDGDGIIFTPNLDLFQLWFKRSSTAEFEGYGPKTSRPKAVNTARPNSIVVNAVRANQCHPQKEDQGYVDSGRSRHMTGNMSYLSDFKDLMEDMLHLGEEPKEEELLLLQSSGSNRRMINEQVYCVVIEGKTHEDLHSCLLAYFLSQEEPKKNKKEERGYCDRKQGRCAHGYTKEEGMIMRGFCSVTRIDAIRAVLSICYSKICCVQMDVKSASTPIETSKPLLKDVEVEDVDVNLYRLMIGSLMYLTASRPNIMFVDSPFDLKAYTDSDYAAASLDKKSTTRCSQFLGKRLISWQCKKQTIVANPTTEAEYVVASSCYGRDYARMDAWI
ncbi:ribonuclease H-like domain-containing protein [Tanacetum coccineum]